MSDLSWITLSFGKTPGEINRGWCYMWAWLAKRTYRGARLWVAHDPDKLDGDHAFVQIGDLWYDAEHPLGVSAPNQLTFFSHLGDEPFAHKEMSDHAFIKFWGGLKDSRWDDCDLPRWPGAM